MRRFTLLVILAASPVFAGMAPANGLSTSESGSTPGQTIPAPVLAPQDESQDLSPEARVDAIFAEMDKPDSPGCAVSAMRQGAIVYKRGYGMANLEYGVPITPASVFHVASVSKQFTAFAIALLAAEGKLSLDDEIHQYVPEVPDHGAPITIRHLLHHTSGLRDQWALLSMAGWRWEADVVTQKDVLEIIALQEALNFAPGDEYLYSNTGYTLLAVIVERISGQSLREFTTERIFEPLGMTATHFHDDHEMIVLNRAYAYEPADEGSGARAGGFTGDLKQSIPDFDVVGATSLFTTVEDLARWDRNFYTQRIGGPDLMEWMHTRGVLNSGEEISYALALVHGEHRGLKTISHGGSDAGFRSHFLRYPEQGLSVAVLCNFPSSNPGDRARQVAEVYLGDQMEAAAGEGAGRSDEPPAEMAIPEDELAAFAGLYRYRGTDRAVRLRMSEGKLLWGEGRPRRLVPVGDGRFWRANDGVLVAIERASAGDAAVVTVPADSDDPQVLDLSLIHI